MRDDDQGDGWLFKLSTTLGARHAHPAWPVATEPVPEPALRRRMGARPEATPDADAGPADNKD
jgi:hypothetical protein